MKLTFDEVIENHRKMWNWIADETEKRKEIVDKVDYFIENNIDEYILHRCFCCQYASDRERIDMNCEICPIDWGFEIIHCVCENKLTDYAKWLRAKDYQSAAKYARQIANLPVRREVMEC